MQLIQVKCSSCGANAEVDEYSKSFLCKYCGATTLIEKEHTSYIDESNDEDFKTAHEYITIHNNYKEAKDKYERILRRTPANPNAIWGIIICYTKDFTEKLYFEVPNSEPQWFEGLYKQINLKYEDYLKCETKEETKQQNIKIFEDYVSKNEEEFHDLKNNAKNNNDVKIEQIVSDEKNENNQQENNYFKLIPILLSIVIAIIIFVIIIANIIEN